MGMDYCLRGVCLTVVERDVRFTTCSVLAVAARQRVGAGDATVVYGKFPKDSYFLLCMILTYVKYVQGDHIHAGC
jgi:hypothetical protein